MPRRYSAEVRRQVIEPARSGTKVAQPGRHIATLRRSAGLGVPVALITLPL